MPSCNHLFLRNHIPQATIAITSIRSKSKRWKINSRNYTKFWPSHEHFWKQELSPPHTSFAAEQLQRAWIVSSSSNPQQGHKASVTTLLLNKLSLVGSKSWHALHRIFFYWISDFKRPHNLPYWVVFNNVRALPPNLIPFFHPQMIGTPNCRKKKKKLLRKKLKRKKLRFQIFSISAFKQEQYTSLTL